MFVNKYIYLQTTKKTLTLFLLKYIIQLIYKFGFIMSDLILNNNIENFKQLILSQEEVRSAFLFSISDDSFISFTEYLFPLIEEEDFLDTFMVSVYSQVFNSENFQIKTAEIFFNQKLKENVKETILEEDKNTFKAFLKQMPNGFESFVNEVISKCSLNAVKFIFEKANLNHKDYVSVAYHNTIDVFFYVFDNAKISNKELNSLIKNKLKSDKFNFEIVKELVLSDKLIVDNELSDFVIMDKIRIFKKFDSKSNNLKTELFKI